VPPSACALVASFGAISVAAGLAAWWVVGPRRARAAILPIVAAVGALYLVGHRLYLGFGPNIRLFGFEVASISGLLVAVGAAVVAALLQRGLAVRLGRWVG